MEMHQIRYFLAVCEELNFTRAAKRCNVSQPSLTRAVKRLEQEFGGPLFLRDRAHTHLTELGRIVRPHMALIAEQVDEARRTAFDHSRDRRSVLRLGVMCTIAPTFLVDIVQSIRRNHPSVQLELADSVGWTITERLMAGEFDAAIYGVPGLERDDRLHRLPLFREQFMIVVSPGHRLAGKPVITVRDLEAEPYVQRVRCEYNDDVDTVFDEHGVDCPTVARLERDDWAQALVSTGEAFGFMPAHCVSHPGLVARPLVMPEVWREVSLTTVRGRPHSPAVGALVREAMRTRWGGPERRAPARESDAAPAD